MVAISKIMYNGEEQSSMKFDLYADMKSSASAKEKRKGKKKSKSKQRSGSPGSPRKIPRSSSGTVSTAMITSDDSLSSFEEFGMNSILSDSDDDLAVEKLTLTSFFEESDDESDDGLTMKKPNKRRTKSSVTEESDDDSGDEAVSKTRSKPKSRVLDDDEFDEHWEGRVDEILADYNESVDDDQELIEIRKELEDLETEGVKMEEDFSTADEERRQDIEKVKKAIKKLLQTNAERQEAMEDEILEEIEKMEKIDQKYRKGFKKLEATMEVANEVFEKMKSKIQAKTKKREKLAVEMKLNAKRAIRRIGLRGAKDRIARDAANKKDTKPTVDMSEFGRRERVYSWYIRTAMPAKKELLAKVSRLPPSAYITTQDVELLPWNDRETRVNVRKINEIMKMKR